MTTDEALRHVEDYVQARRMEGDCDLREIISAIIDLRQRISKIPPFELQERVAFLIAHRACGNQESDPMNGKLAGYCVVCQTPWPCDYAKDRTEAGK